MSRYFSRCGTEAAAISSPLSISVVELVELRRAARDALPYRLLADEVGRQEPYDALVQRRAGKRTGSRAHARERGEALRRERVVRALACLSRLLAGGEIAEPLEPLRLGVDTGCPRRPT